MSQNQRTGLCCALLALAGTVHAGSLPPETPVGDAPGVFFRYYQVTANFVDDMTGVVPTSTGTSNVATGGEVYPATGDAPGGPPFGSNNGSSFSPAPRLRNNDYGFIWSGYIDIPVTGTWTFYTNSDDGSKVFLGPQQIQVVDNDGPHGLQERAGSIDLDAGKHYIVVKFGQGNGGHNFSIAWENVAGGTPKGPIPNNRLTAEPAIVADPTFSPSFGLAPVMVTISTTTPGASIFYTTDGSAPTTASTLYTGPFNVATTTTVRAVAVLAGSGPSQFTSANYVTLRPPDAAGPTMPGLYFEHTTGGGNFVADVALGTLVSNGTLTAFNAAPSTVTVGGQATPDGVQSWLNNRIQNDNIGFAFTGYVNITVAGLYRFYTTSDDGSKLFIGGQELVNNDGGHGMIERPTPTSTPDGRIGLDVGTHAILVQLKQGGGGYGLEVRYERITAPALAKQLVPDSLFVTPAGPTISPAGGSFSGSQVVTITSPAGGNIYYSLGSASLLTNTSATALYNGPFTITAGTTVRAIAYPPAGKTGISEATFTRTDVPPVPIRAIVLSPTTVDVTFDKALDTPSSQVPGNYVITGGAGPVAVVSATQDLGQPELVHLVTGALTPATAMPYILTVTNVSDTLGNAIPPPGADIQFRFIRNGINMDRFDGIGGTAVTDLTGNAAYPNSPSTRAIVTTLEEPTADNGSNFGVRFYGYFVPNQNGVYTFGLASDDGSELRLSTDANPANALTRLARGGAPFVFRDYDTAARYDSFAMTAGTRYYIEGLVKEGGGGDNLSIAAKPFDGTHLVDGSAPLGDATVLTSSIEPFDLSLLQNVVITAHPGDKTAITGGTVQFNVSATGTGPLTYQWQKDGVDIGVTQPTLVLQGVVAGNAGVYRVIVTGVEGSATSNGATLTVLPPTGAVTITNVNPPAGPVVGGQTVTITGTNFVPGQTVVFFGTIQAAANATSATSITAVTPAQAAGPVDVKVSTFGDFSVTLANGYIYADPPTITGIVPGNGPALGGTSVTISGTNLATTNSVTFGAVAATINPPATDPSVTVTTADYTGAGPGPAITVTVTTGGGTATTSFTIDNPTVASVTPNQGPLAGGQSVTIAGTNFIGSNTAGDLGLSTLNTVNVTSPLSLTAVTTAHAPGLVPASVTTFGTQTGSTAGLYEYLDFPTVTSISPNLGPGSGGQSVTIMGTNFSVGNTTVDIGGAAATGVTVTSPTMLTATTPAHAPGIVDVTVTTFGAISPQTSAPLVAGYTYQPPPTISAITPALGPTSGGQSVVVDGTNFIVGGTTVTFDVSAATITAESTSQLTVTTPAHGAATVTVTVSTVGGMATTSYDYVNPPTVTGISPVFGGTAGGTAITISGTNFVAGFTTVDLGGSPATGVTVIGPTTLTATTSAHAPANVDVTVTTFGLQNGTLPGAYDYNDPPVANAQAVSLPEDTLNFPITVTGSDSSNDPLTFALVTGPTNGVLNGALPNVTYTPTADYNGPDSFTFTVSDAFYTSAPATVSITVTPVNDPPVVNNGTLTTQEDTPASGTLSGSDPDPADPLVFAIATNGTLGTAVVTDPATGAFTYTPNPNANGADSFTFTLSDGTATAGPATVTVTITPVNDAPVAVDGTLTTTEETAASGTLSASDVEGTPLSFTIATNGTLGTAVITNAATGAFTYTPNANVSGIDTFTFTARDGVLTSNVATVTVTIIAVNDPPTAAATNFTTPEDTAVSGTLSGADADGDPLVFSIVNNGTIGTAVITNPATGDFTYTPNPNFSGNDSFTFRVSDGQAVSSTVSVAVIVTAVNDVPVAFSQNFVIGTGQTVGFRLSGFDVEGGGLTFAITLGAANGTLTGTLPNLVYTPNAGFSGTENIGFTVTDEDGAVSATAFITVVVSPAPVFDSPPLLSPNPALTGQALFGAAPVSSASGTALIVWSWGDGTTATGAGVSHTYTLPGIYTVTITATSPQGISTTATIDVFVSLPLGGTTPNGVPGGTTLPGTSGIVVGGAGAGPESLGTGQIICNYLKRDRTTYAGSLGNIAFPSTLTQLAMVGQPGVLTIGQGPLAQTFYFTLGKNGRGRATGLSRIEVNLKKKLFRFKAGRRPELTDLTETLGGTWNRDAKIGPNVTLFVPVRLQVDNQIFMAMTFLVDYHQIGNKGKGTLAP